MFLSNAYAFRERKTNISAVLPAFLCSAILSETFDVTITSRIHNLLAAGLKNERTYLITLQMPLSMAFSLKSFALTHGEAPQSIILERDNINIVQNCGIVRPHTAMTISGRDKEASLIRQANRAAAVGRLMLGEIRDWSSFLEADCIPLTNLPRRCLKSGKADVKERLSAEIDRFCQKNFKGMTVQRLAAMYEDIKAFRGLELPLIEFEQRFAQVRSEILKGNPSHLTVCISLWGLQYRIPEEQLAKDITEAAELVSQSQDQLDRFQRYSHAELLHNRSLIESLLRRKLFAARSAVIACFNLLEAYLNGIAWDYLRTADKALLSNNNKKLLEDTRSVSIRDKLQKYPEIIAGNTLWDKEDTDLNEFLTIVKPFRDSLVHPSPFATPEKFGGYDKLRLLYRIDEDTAYLAIYTSVSLILRIHKHIKPTAILPPWLEDLHNKFVHEK
jgi:hypothetical protein